LYQTRQDIDDRLNDITDHLTILARATTVEGITEALEICWEVFSPLPQILRDWGKRATVWAVESVEEENKEWHVEPYGVAIWEHYGLAMQLEVLHQEIENGLSQSNKGVTDMLFNSLEYFQRLMDDFRRLSEEHTAQFTQDVVDMRNNPTVF
jgi:hypothetical protein